MSRSKTVRKLVLRTVLLAGVAAGAWYGYRFMRSLPQRQEQIATTRVRQGDVVVRSYTRGELRTVRSATLTAPNLFGTVQVTRLAPLGAFAREGDLVVEFDDSEVNSRVEEKELEIEQTEEQIKKATADLEMRNNQDQVDLLSARYAVRRAELEVKRNELLSAIDAQKNELTLKEARQRLKQLESDIKSRQQQAQAQLATLREEKNKALLELAREKQRLAQVRMLAPMSGLVAMRQNRTGFMFPGMQIPDIREGDQVRPGMPVADILDLSEMEVVAKVGELDRANLREGQEATLMLDALPDKQLHARIKNLSGTATANVFSFDPAKKFDVVFAIDMKQLLSALGAKPEQIQKILATAEQNRKKGFATPSTLGGGITGANAPVMVAMPGAGAAGPQTMAATPFGAGEGADQQGGDQTRIQRRGDSSGGGQASGRMTGLTPEQQQKFREAMQKITNGKSFREMTDEERSQVRSKMQQVMAEIRKSSGGAPPSQPAQAGPPGMTLLAGPGAAGLAGFGGRGAGQRFSAEQIANAKLPPPPEEDTQFDVLLRPGLLADVEIIVDKVPNAVYVPNQAVFESEGKPVVYVKAGNAFEPRAIKPLKRSESVLIVAEGVKPGEVIALADPTAAKSDKGTAREKKGGAMSALPGGGK
jgi:HlyD family secretion protein